MQNTPSAKEIFLRALEIEDSQARAEFLASACANDDTLRRRVDALLAAHDDPDSYLERPAARFDVTATSDGTGRDSGLSDSSSSHHGRFLPGTKVASRYRIVSMLGRGGMGEVYRADDLRLGQTVALKFLPPELAKDAKRLEYFHNEVKLARQISHPNVCRVYDIGDVAGQHYISMEYIDGEDLKSLLQRIGRLPKDKGLQIARQLCAGLSAAHAKGVLHRDLKPANIMIDGQGQVRITDFGLSAVAANGESIVGVAGTPAYMAPEQLLRGQTNVQSDVYALGLVLFELFTGGRAHSVDTLAELRQLHEHSSGVDIPANLSDEIEPAVQRVIARCLTPDPTDRPRSVGELLFALPGGDPLAAALAAGDTPAPELVAAAGGNESLSPKIAWSLFAGTIMGLIIVIAIAQHSHLINRVGPVLEPQVLRYRAENILRQLGYDKPRYSDGIAYGFDHRDTQNETITLATQNELKDWPLIGFWYRESDEGFASETMGYRLRTSGPTRVDEANPPWDFGMRGVRLGPTGQLLTFRALPALGVINTTNDADVPPWKEWFTKAVTGFDLASLVPVDTTNVPPVQFDHIQSWQVNLPSAERQVTIVAASFQGTPVYYDVQQKINVKSSIEEKNLGFFVLVFAIAVLNVVSLVLVPRNMYLGRWDRRGAWRLFLCMFVVGLLARLCGAYHVPNLWERVVILICIASAFVWAGELWVYYVSFEPFVRRWWPQLLFSWSRLLSGRLSDAKVGADMLVGVLAGTVYSALFLFPSTFENAPPVVVSADTLVGIPHLIGRFLMCVYWSTFVTLLFTFALAALRLALRSQCLAAFVVVVIAGLSNSIDSAHFGYWVFQFLSSTLIVILLVRRGLLTALVASLVGELMLSPLTTDVSAFYFSNGLLSTMIVVALAFYGAITATNARFAWNKMVPG